MNKESSLLPWILGGLSMATVAVAITVASANKTVAPSLQLVSAIAAPAASSADLLSLSTATPTTIAPIPAPAAAAASGASPAPLTATPTQITAEPPAHSGQIWECTTNGLRTFSNNPCGEKSSLFEARAINIMNPTPVVRYSRAYAAQPRYAPESADQNAYSDQDTYADQGAADPAGNSYAVIQGFAFLPRKSSEHPHRPSAYHGSGSPPPRRN